MERLEVVNTVKSLIQPYLKEHSIYLYDVEFEQVGKDNVLRILIQKEDGTMDLDTCVSVSEYVGALMDKEDLIKDEYNLEVCSPGTDRPLNNREDYQRALNKAVQIELIEPINGIDGFIGILIELNELDLVVEYKVKNLKKKVNIPFTNIKKANTTVIF